MSGSEFSIKYFTHTKFLTIRVEDPTFSNIKQKALASVPGISRASNSLIYSRNVFGGAYINRINVIVAFEDEVIEPQTIVVRAPKCDTCFALLGLSSCITDGKCARLP